MTIVLFAGLGGSDRGLEDAGYPVNLALNHDEIALAAHRALNPHTRQLRADIREVEPLDAVGGRRVGQLWASPDCTDFSSAKGAAPRSPRVRSLPWQICRWVGRLRKRGLGPDVVYLENVKEIRGWGPLVAMRDKATGRVIKIDDTVAAKGEHVPVNLQKLTRDPSRSGRTYRAWVRHMERLGATYEDRDLCCGDYGVPTTRTRLFGIAHFDGRKALWPTVTNGRRKLPSVMSGALLPHVPVASIIDWSVPLPSIFERSKPLVLATLKRVALGMKRFVLETTEPFLIHLTHQGSRAAMDVNDAIPTITGAHRGEIALVGPTLIPTCHSTSPPRAHDGREAAPTFTAAVKGGELAVSAAFLTPYHGARRPNEARGRCVGDSLPTQTTENRFGVVAAYLEEHRTRSIGHPADAGLPTQTGRDHHAVVGAFMVQHNTGVIGHPVSDALSTLTTLGTQQHVAGAFLVHQRGTSTALPIDGGMPTLTTGGNRGGDHVGIAAAILETGNVTAPAHEPDGEALTPATLARARRVAEFLRAQGVWSGGDIVTVGSYVVVDIGMRMLLPAEAAAAHELRLPPTITIQKRDRAKRPVRDPDGNPVWITRPLTKSESMRLIGNSVPRRMARLLAELNGPLALGRAMPLGAMVAAE